MAKNKPTVSDPEIAAISIVYDALRALNAEAQKRVLDYVAGKIGGPAMPIAAEHHNERWNEEPSPGRAATKAEEPETDVEGISPVALKWMTRSGLTPSRLSALFSLGVDEIDLVAKKVPGEGKKERMHSVLLLKGIAAYLSTGAARVTHEQLKEACLHYDAYDGGNFARHLKSFSSEASGAKESGYTLTARGLTNATETIRNLVSPK
ncbi:MAG: hypothetical protein WBD59_13150 [Candidatus Sulfotelmatobacter sp.]